MKAILHGCALFGLLALAGCQTTSESLDVAAYRQAHPIRIEFARSARIYEEGDALFAMVNDTRQVLWFDGNGPESPAYRLKTGSTTAAERTIPRADDAAVFERVPISPGDIRYFTVSAGKATGAISIGITFYTSRTGTNAIPIWSSPVTLSSKRR